MVRKKESLDMYYSFPEDMRNYMSNYGRHFSKKMYEWAVSLMYKENGARITPITKEQFNQKLQQHNIKIENDVLYDGMYVYSMTIADFYPTSIPDEKHVLLFVKDYVDDPDALDGFIFNRFYADCCLKGEPIDWERML